MSLVFDSEFQRRLEVLKRLVARALAGRGGAGRSPLHERGGRVEFAGHRPYSAGDEVRSIDWSAYARLEALVVKEFEAPREAHLLLVLDRSASMDCFGKDAASLRVAAALGWLGLAAGARVSCCSRAAASRWLSAKEHFPELLAALEKLPKGAAADLPAAVERAPALGTGRRTAVIFSDLYEAEPATRALAALRRRAATVVCAQVVAPEELRAPAVPAVALRDAETGEILRVRLDAATRSRFHAEGGAFLAERAALAARHGARLCRVAPRDDLLAAVERVVVGGERA
ncbi:MAG: DUF58 domain-containing protein [Planctomycetota bacterium]|jgi:uncharacterized protein (DUF58 family)